MKAEFRRQPGPSLLEQLPRRDRESLGLYTHEIETGLGCGNRPCRICCYSAPTGQGSMEFSTIQEFHRIKREFNPRMPIRHFRANDVLYYRSQLRGVEKTYVDVYRDATEQGVVVDDVLTHGFLPGEELPQRSAGQLVAWAQANRIPPFMGFSLDPYGYIGVDADTQRVGIAISIASLEPVLKKILAFYNPNNPEEYGLPQTQALIEATVPQHLRHLIQFEKLYGLGRANGLDETLPDYNNQLPGYSIRFNGNLFLTPEQGAAEKKIGNIYKELPLPLPVPIPRAPDFDEFD